MERWLEAVTVFDGEGRINLGERGPVYVAIMHEGGSYFPRGVIVVDQNPYHDLSNEVLTTGLDILKDDAMKDEKFVKELQEEWGDRWEEILTENHDGRVWSFNDPYEAAAAISTDKRVPQFVEINEPEE